MAGSPLFKETVSSLTQPPETSSCETWFYQPSAFLLLASVVFLLGVSLGFSEELGLCGLWVQAGTKENFTIFCTACPRMKWMEKNERLMSSAGSASLASWLGTREEVKCIVLEQNMPFAFGCDSNIRRFMYHALLINFCAPTVYVKLVSSPVITHQRSEAWNPLFSPPAVNVHFSPC